MFLLGLQKLGKGDWRGISRNYVISRTPTQAASHAQKYFIRQSNMSRIKRRSSLFDIVADEPLDTPVGTHDLFSANHAHGETKSNRPSMMVKQKHILQREPVSPHVDVSETSADRPSSSNTRPEAVSDPLMQLDQNILDRLGRLSSVPLRPSSPSTGASTDLEVFREIIGQYASFTTLEIGQAA